MRFRLAAESLSRHANIPWREGKRLRRLPAT
jgi:hypothetical protein